MRTLARLAVWVLFVLAFVTFVGAANFAGGGGRSWSPTTSTSPPRSYSAGGE